MIRTSDLAPRALRTTAVSLLALLVLSGCGAADEADRGADRSSTTTEVLGEPVRGGTIEVGLEAETNNLLPSQGTFAAAGYNIAHAIYDPLMTRSESGELKPFLAESMVVDDALDTWTLTLRPGITFHDGSALTAEVLKGNFDEYLTRPGSTTAGSLEQVEELRVVDELTVVYELREGNAVFPDLLARAPGWPFSMEAAERYGDDSGSNPVGTGPFRFESWSRDDHLRLARNEAYWRDGLPYLDGITFRPIPDEASRVSSLQSGQVDAMISLRGSAIKQVRDADGFVAHIHVGNESNGSIMNVLEPPFDDVRIRKAFAHSLNPDDVAAVLGDDGLVEASTQFFSPDSHWYSQKVADAYPAYDPARARELVDDYVADPDRSDGRAVGMRPVMTFSCPPDASLLEIAQLAEQEGEAAGIDVELRQVEQAVHIGRAIGSTDSEPPYRGDYQVNCWRMGDEDDPATTLAKAFGDPATEPLNFTNFHRDEIDDLLEELRTTVAFAERYALVERISLLVNEGQPYLFATGTPTMVGGRSQVKNIAGWTLPDGSAGNGTPNAVTRWGEVWLEE